MAFEDDVFVSYSHLDDQAFEGRPGWISELHRALAWRLPQLLGKQAKIWRDPKLQGNDIFAATIVDRLPHVAVLVSVVSPPYIRSEWCKRELDEFLRASAATGGIRVADKMRVFKVVKMPVSVEDQPAELRSMIGYEFYTVDVETGRKRELGPMASPEVRPLYWSRVDDLAQDITDLLNTLDGQNGNGAPHSQDTGANAATAPRAAKEAVYLAETTHDLRERRDAIRRELQSRGYLVLPDQPLPLVAAECVPFVRAQLERARLSIHMIGANYGVVPEGHVDSTVVLQHQLAIERAASAPLHRLIWIPPDVAASDERQRQFIAHLRNDARAQSGADLLEASLEDFKTILQARLITRDEGAKDPRPASGGTKHVYVICDQRDRDTVRPLEDLLYSEGFEVIPTSFEGDETDLRRDHEENLVSCDAMLIYWGAGSEQWLRRKLREQQKSLGYGRTKPMLATGVFLAPPLNDDKLRFRSHEAVVVNWSTSLTPGPFEPFFCRLR